MTFRKTTQNDYCALADMRWIHLEDDGENLSAYNKQTFVSEFCTYLKCQIDKNFYCYVAEHEGQIIGNVYLGLLSKVPKPYCSLARIGYITNVHVLEKYRNCGIGSELMNFAKEQAKNLACELLYAWPSERAVPYYERLGFKADNEILECPI
jgi:Predicted acetyltransferase